MKTWRKQLGSADCVPSEKYRKTLYICGHKKVFGGIIPIIFPFWIRLYGNDGRRGRCDVELGLYAAFLTVGKGVRIGDCFCDCFDSGTRCNPKERGRRVSEVRLRRSAAWRIGRGKWIGATEVLVESANDGSLPLVAPALRPELRTAESFRRGRRGRWCLLRHS